MNYYALLYELVDDMVNRRVPFREEHLRLAREARERGELVLAGALTEPVDRALLVFLVGDKSKVEDFARKDPYVVNGLAKKWEVRPWNVVVGNENAASSGTPGTETILRQWTARTSQEQWPRYRAHFSIKVLPELRRVSGFLAATLFVRHASDEVEILVETSWRSLESIRGFASPDVEAAVVSEEATAMLTEFDGHVRHYEIAERS
ncbi:MAG TPA: YciI-like protein [Candidatus Acidoferrum sp.]|nr:YciI-like protein [Candidatus Acidoferrum sp.]